MKQAGECAGLFQTSELTLNQAFGESLNRSAELLIRPADTATQGEPDHRQAHHHECNHVRFRNGRVVELISAAILPRRISRHLKIVVTCRQVDTIEQVCVGAVRIRKSCRRSNRSAGARGRTAIQTKCERIQKVSSQGPQLIGTPGNV